MSHPIHGTVAEGFERVRDVFQANFDQRGEVGASFCATVDGEVVVDLWGGVADKKTRRPWEADTLSVCWSTTKGWVASCFALLADRGELDYDRPVSDFWPEFTGGGKEQVTVRTLLEHRSGLSTLDSEPLVFADFADPDKVAAACAAQLPMWEPGSRQGYAPVAWGAFAGAVFHKLAGVSLGQFLAKELAGPLGADVYLGLPEELEPRVATLYPVGFRRMFKLIGTEMLRGNTLEGRLYRRLLFQPKSLTSRAFKSTPSYPRLDLGLMNTRAMHALELPWGSGIASARGIARLYSALACGGTVDGVTVCRPESLEFAHRRSSWADADSVMLKPLGFTCGYLKDEPGMFSPHVETFGHAGMGGSLGFADPRLRMAWGYALNAMDIRVRPARTLALTHALYDACAAKGMDVARVERCAAAS